MAFSYDCRNEDSFGDSAMVCTLRDIASFGRLLMQGGIYEGKRLMNEAADRLEQLDERVAIMAESMNAEWGNNYS